jgi:hypothetical protein
MGLILPLVFAAFASPAALPALTFDATRFRWRRATSKP